MDKDIRNTNSKRQYHGYHEWYLIYDYAIFRGMYKNGLKVGYLEWHRTRLTDFYIR
jgi:hypothetical protein